MTEQKKQQNALLYGNPSEKRKVFSRTHRLTPTNIDTRPRSTCLMHL